MNSQPTKIKLLTFFIGASVVLHLLILFSLGRFGSYVFASPVKPPQPVMIDLAKPDDLSATVANSDPRNTDQRDEAAEDAPDEPSPPPAIDHAMGTPSAIPEKSQDKTKTVETGRDKSTVVAKTAEPVSTPPAASARQTAPPVAIAPPLRTAGEFLTTKREKLTYQISLLGVPVGSAELEATNKNGEVRITLRTKSNQAASSIFPVDNLIETRHIGGNIIITKVSQQEGTFKRDIGYTIFLRDKRVFWVDRTRNRYADETIPNSDVLDTLSSFYYLRNRQLQVGTSELLHIYDGDTYAPVPVEIVRQEEIRLRNFRKVDTLLVRHVQQKEGIFKRTGDMLVWLTNDENKVPVRMETTIPIGNITAELVAAETELPEEMARVQGYPY